MNTLPSHLRASSCTHHHDVKIRSISPLARRHKRSEELKSARLEPQTGQAMMHHFSQGARRQLHSVGLIFIGLCTVLLAPTISELAGVSLLPWASLQNLLALRGVSAGASPAKLDSKFRITFDGLSRKSMGIAKALTAEEEYQSTTGRPPPGFEAWLEFAKERQCHLGPYTRIDKDLDVFRDLGNPQKRRITPEQILATKLLPRTVLFVIRNGTLHTEGGSAGWRENFSRLINGVVKYLPDMDFVVNTLDEPRVLPGEEDSIDARFNSSQCARASQDFKKFRHLHGTFNNRPSGIEYFPTKERLPLLSQSKINECHDDITFPTYYGWDSLLSEEQQKQLLPWKNRQNVLFFRGSTTGGQFRLGQNYSLAHRQRLVEAGQRHPHMDVKFTAFIQCESVCQEMEARYGKAEYIEQMDNFKKKYLMSIDGNSFVSRLPHFMSSASVPFRAGLYSEWFDEWVRHKEHYLHIDLDYGNLEETLAWAIEHDSEAEAIGKRAQKFALTRLRNDDMECYMYRLLLEYAAIVY